MQPKPACPEHGQQQQQACFKQAALPTGLGAAGDHEPCCLFCMVFVVFSLFLSSLGMLSRPDLGMAGTRLLSVPPKPGLLANCGRFKVGLSADANGCVPPSGGVQRPPAQGADETQELRAVANSALRRRWKKDGGSCDKTCLSTDSLMRRAIYGLLRGSHACCSSKEVRLDVVLSWRVERGRAGLHISLRGGSNQRIQGVHRMSEDGARMSG